MPTGDHPLLKGLRVIREPRGLAQRVVEVLCREHLRPAVMDPDWDPGLPSDKEIAAELKVSVATVAEMIDKVARTIIADSFDIEMIPRRARIFIWYRHRLWEQRVAARATRPTGT